MGFPDKFLWFTRGWRDLGQVEGTTEGKYIIFSSHKFCLTKCHIGRENGIVFMFCPRCLMKITKSDDNFK